MKVAIFVLTSAFLSLLPAAMRLRYLAYMVHLRHCGQISRLALDHVVSACD